MIDTAKPLHSAGTALPSRYPLLITTHAAPLNGEALHAALSHGGIALLNPNGLHADVAQRAEARFYALYRQAAKIAATHDGLLLCPPPMTAPTPNAPWGMQRLLCAEEPLLSQFIALLRVSETARVALLLPYVQSTEEIDHARTLLDRAMQELYRRQEPFDETLPLGILLGTSQAVLSSRALLSEVDFLMLDADALQAQAPTSATSFPLRRLEIGVGNAHLLHRFVVIGGKITLSPSHLPHLLAMGADALCLPTATAPEGFFRCVE